MPWFSSGLPPSYNAEVSPNLTLFTPGVSHPGAQFNQVPCVYQFHHPGLRTAAASVPEKAEKERIMEAEGGIEPPSTALQAAA